MYPILFRWELPEWLLNALPFLPETISPKAYGTLIALGILCAWWYGTREGKKLGIAKETITDMMVWIMVSAFVGGKFFFYLEDPGYYFSSIDNMTNNFGNGFVFYGSMLFVIPTLWWFFKKKKLPTFKMLDIIAIGGAITHAFGRLGCFMAGCCHGVETESFLGVIFTHPECRADPLGKPLHPTQLYSIAMLLVIITLLLLLKKRQKFDGQLFPVYLMIYAVGRSVIEEFRGDEARGFVFDGPLSHSQFISIFIFFGAIWLYRYLQQKGKQSTKQS